MNEIEMWQWVGSIVIVGLISILILRDHFKWGLNTKKTQKLSDGYLLSLGVGTVVIIMGVISILIGGFLLIV